MGTYWRGRIEIDRDMGVDPLIGYLTSNGVPSSFSPVLRAFPALIVGKKRQNLVTSVPTSHEQFSRPFTVKMSAKNQQLRVRSFLFRPSSKGIACCAFSSVGLVVVLGSVGLDWNGCCPGARAVGF